MNTDLYTDVPLDVPWLATPWRWVFRGSEGDQKGRD